MFVNSARCSFGKAVDTMSKKDEKLVKYLAEHKHYTPFRHSGATFRITCPLFTARQIHKHQVGVTVNEISGRYVEFEGDDWWIPHKWRTQSANVKQGSDGDYENQMEAQVAYEVSVKFAVSIYKRLVSIGISKEQARAVLPQGMLTQFWMSASLQAWAHFCNLRVDSHAQKEIQEYAHEIGETMGKLFPVAWKELTK
jgi:thymidylate synthase (FAD)